MLLARVTGHATSTIKHASMKGCRLLLCEAIDASGKGLAQYFIAADYLGAGHGQQVFVTTDGEAAELHHGDAHSPIRNCILGLADHLEEVPS